MLTIRHLEDGKWKSRPPTRRERLNFNHYKRKLAARERKGLVKHIAIEKLK